MRCHLRHSEMYVRYLHERGVLVEGVYLRCVQAADNAGSFAGFLAAYLSGRDGRDAAYFAGRDAAYFAGRDAAYFAGQYVRGCAGKHDGRYAG